MSRVSDDPTITISKKTDGIPGVDRKHRPSDFYHETTNFQFIKHSRRYLIISGLIVLISLAVLPIRGLNLGIDFKGGISWEVKAQNGVVPTIAGARDALKPTGQSDARVTILSPASGGKSIRVQAKLLDDPLTDIENAISKSTGVEPANVLVDVSGTRGTFTASHVSKPNQAAVEKAVRAVGVTGTVKVTGSEVVLTVSKMPVSPQDKVTDALAAYAHAQPADVTLNTVGPTWGHEVSRKALQALVVFFIVLALYLGIRFEPKMSGAAIVAVLHDIAFTVGVYAIVRFPVTPATVTAFLTILGFSLYDTVVVFDKVRENTGYDRGHGPQHLRRDGRPVAEPGADAVDLHVAGRVAARRLDARRRLVHPRRDDPRRLRARAARRPLHRYVLVDLRRDPAPRVVEGTGAAVQGAQAAARPAGGRGAGRVTTGDGARRCGRTQRRRLRRHRDARSRAEGAGCARSARRSPLADHAPSPPAAGPEAQVTKR